MEPWHALPAEEVGRRLGAPPQGLTSAEAAARLARTGPNELPEANPSRWPRVLAAQFTSITVALLLAAAIVSYILDEPVDAAAILVIVLLNALLGFGQEWRTERALAALRESDVPLAKVSRDGLVLLLPARDVVPGDVAIIESGAAVPADGRLLSAVQLAVDESMLTGESLAVEKSAEVLLAPETAQADRRNMAFRGTNAVRGRGRMLVTETGAATELGRIAGALQSIENPRTPLQRRLDTLGRQLAVAAVLIVVVIFAIGWAAGGAPDVLILTAVSLAVAAVPEGLPAVVTITLALAAQRMARRRALVRRLAAVETLGSVTDICTDKTGTLTENRLTVRRVVTLDGSVDWPAGGTAGREVRMVLAAAALCGDAIVQRTAEGEFAVGEPTEAALALAAVRAGIPLDEMNEDCPRVGEVPFDAARRWMLTLHATGTAAGLPRCLGPIAGRAPYLALVKGAAEVVVPACDFGVSDGELVPLADDTRHALRAAAEEMAAGGLRVLAVAARRQQTNVVADDLSAAHTTAVMGLIGLGDPLRQEAAAAVRACRSAGISVTLLTGDHASTASAIARAAGIEQVHARVTPAEKLQIVERLQHAGRIVAMTGDGVNDAPALERADVGVAMGLAGTDVAREASDVVLEDDNFATLVTAVHEGRVVFDNIRKFVRYILSSNVGELLVMMAGPLVGMPLPLVPVQILWINLVTDGLPALALAVDPAEPDVMQRPPRPPGEPIINRESAHYILALGAIIAAITIAAGVTVRHYAVAQAQTAIFTTLTLAQIAQVLAIRTRGLQASGNRPLVWISVATAAVQVALPYLPGVSRVLRIRPLDPLSLLLCVVAAACVSGAAHAWRRRM